MAFSNFEDAIAVIKKIVCTTGKASFAEVIALVKKDQSDNDEVILVDKYEDIYSRQKRHFDAVAGKFENQCALVFAVDKPILWRNPVFEEDTLLKSFQKVNEYWHNIIFEPQFGVNISLDYEEMFLDLSHGVELLQGVVAEHEHIKEERENFFKESKQNSVPNKIDVK